MTVQLKKLGDYWWWSIKPEQWWIVQPITVKTQDEALQALCKAGAKHIKVV